MFIFSFHVAVETPGVLSSPIMGHRLNATRFYYYNAVNSRNKHLIQLSRLKNWHWGSCNSKAPPSPVSVVLPRLYPNIQGCFKERYGKSYSCSLKQHIKGRIFFVWTVSEFFTSQWHTLSVGLCSHYYIGMSFISEKAPLLCFPPWMSNMALPSRWSIYPSGVPQGLRGLFPHVSLGLCGSTAAFCVPQCWVMFSLTHHHLIAELHI